MGRCWLITEKALRERLERKTEATVETRGQLRFRALRYIPGIEPLRNAPLVRPRELLVPTGLPWRVGAGNSPWRRVLAGPSPKPLEIRLSGHGRRRGHAGRLAN